MRSLHDKIAAAIRRGRVVLSIHADNRLHERQIVRWQVVEGFEAGEVIQSHATTKPNPSVLVRQVLADGTHVVAVWAYVESIRSAKLVTVYSEVKR